MSCKNEKTDQSPCGNTDWEFRTNVNTTILFSRGQKNKEVTSAVSLSENCFLVLKSVTEEDVGYYYCRQFTVNGHLSTDPGFQLFVVKCEYLMFPQNESPKNRDSVELCTELFFYNSLIQTVPGTTL